MAKIEDVCHTCGGLGKEGGCPRCGRTLRSAVAVRSIHLDIPANVIPIAYQEKLWERPQEVEKLLPKFRDFDATLEKVLNKFLAGEVPKFSMFIASPVKYGKHFFGYSCMQTALAQGFSVAPMFSTSDWRRVYRVSQMNPMYKLYDKYRWDSLVTLDVVFIVVDNSEDRFDVIRLLKDVLDTRARMNLSTFIISDYKLEDLTPKWDEKSYHLIYNPDPTRDFLRYPVIIQRFE